VKAEPMAAARAVADYDNGIVLASVEIAASPERIFDALTTQEVVKWWGSEGVYTTTEWSADLRVGGLWRGSGKTADGEAFAVEGKYLELDRPHKVVQTWKPDWDGGHESTLTYRIEPIATGSRVTIRHEGFAGRAESAKRHGEGWVLVLGWLERHCGGEPAPRKFFMIRLLAPRPTFPMDMTPEEAAVMQAHVAYWTEMMRQGKAHVFGPVLDPKGPWGLGVVTVSDEAELAAFEAGDPVIRSQRGFRYEVLPMLRAVVRE
jgi:uncharacterized protein YndB with AHSA1/START domain